jgi:hypothetical protein
VTINKIITATSRGDGDVAVFLAGIAVNIAGSTDNLSFRRIIGNKRWIDRLATTHLLGWTKPFGKRGIGHQLGGTSIDQLLRQLSVD